MKKTILSFIIFVLCICFCACAAESSPDPSQSASNTSATPKIQSTQDTSPEYSTPKPEPDVLTVIALIDSILDNGKPFLLNISDDLEFERLYINQENLPEINFIPEVGQKVEVEISQRNIIEHEFKVVEAVINKMTLVQNPDISAQYIRTNGNYDVKNDAIIIESKEQLEDYYLSNRYDNKEDYDRNKYGFDSSYDGIKSFKDAIDKYDDVFFQNNLLVLAVLVEGSGSHRHIVKGVDFNSSGNIINIKRISSGIGTADMATWHIIIEISRNDCLSKTFTINIA